MNESSAFPISRQRCFRHGDREAAARCPECVPAHDEPQCVAVCPVECIVKDPAHAETPEQLQAKFERLQAA